MYYFLGTSPRVIFRKRAVLFGVKGKGMGISGYSIPLQKNIALQEKMYTHIFCFVCVYVLSETEQKSQNKREKKERRQKPAREPKAGCDGAVIPWLFGTRDQFYGRQFFHELIGNGLGMIQVHYIYCAFYFYYYYISSTSDHQALLDPEGWGPQIGDVCSIIHSTSPHRTTNTEQYIRL